MVDGQSSSLNHPTTATTGGASGKPSPANNVGGGTGWGDKGFTKGGINQAEGEGHIAVCDVMPLNNHPKTQIIKLT